MGIRPLVPDAHAAEHTPTSARLRLGHVQAVREAARAGAGIAYLPAFTVARDLARGALVRCFEAWRGPEMELSVIYPSRRHLSPRVRAFVELVLHTFARRSLESYAAR